VSDNKIDKIYFKSIKRYLKNIPKFIEEAFIIKLKKVDENRFIFCKLSEDDGKVFPFRKYKFWIPAQVKNRVEVFLDMKKCENATKEILDGKKYEDQLEALERLNNEMIRVLGETLQKNLLRRLNVKPVKAGNKTVQTAEEVIIEKQNVDISTIGLELQTLRFDNIIINKIVTCLEVKGSSVKINDEKLKKLPYNVIENVCMICKNKDIDDFKNLKETVDKKVEIDPKIDWDYIFLRKDKRSDKELKNNEEWFSDLYSKEEAQ
jgi:hypothetical protein